MSQAHRHGDEGTAHHHRTTRVHTSNTSNVGHTSHTVEHWRAVRTRFLSAGLPAR